MNDMIKELAAKARLIGLSEDKRTMYTSIEPDDLQKFAELLIKECTDICEEEVTYPAGHDGQWEGYGPVKKKRSGQDCANAIRDRFKQ